MLCSQCWNWTDLGSLSGYRQTSPVGPHSDWKHSAQILLHLSPKMQQLQLCTILPKVGTTWLFTDSFFLDWFCRGLCVRGHSAPSHPKPVPAETTSDGRAGLPHPTAIMLHQPVPEEEKYSQQGEDQQPESPLEVQNARYDHQHEKRWKKCNTDMKLIGLYLLMTVTFFKNRHIISRYPLIKWTKAN